MNELEGMVSTGSLLNFTITTFQVGSIYRQRLDQVKWELAMMTQSKPNRFFLPSRTVL